MTTAVLLLLLIVANDAALALPADIAGDDSASTAVTALIAESARLSLPPRVERAFLLTLQGAADALRDGDVARAQTLLKTFVFEVRSVKRARRISSATADALIEKAAKLIAAMSVQSPR